MRASDERTRHRTGQAGFTLIELTVVVVISTITLIAIYESLITQERTYRYQTAAIDAQATSRMALQVVASELREISASAGQTPSMGGSDLLMASEDSMGLRAFRKVGIVCSVDAGTSSVDVYVPGAPFEAGDLVMFYLAGDMDIASDDAWGNTRVTAVGTARDAGCATRWPTYTVQNLQGLGAVTNFQPGSLVRSFVNVRYGNYAYDGMNVLGRIRSDTLAPLVGPILPPDSGGVEFRYFDNTNTEITTLTSEAQRSAVARVLITVRAVSRGGSPMGGDWVDSVSTNVYLRGN